MGALSFLHSLFGWIYFFAWSASFWPQVLLNQRRKTTAGLSPDFVTINIVGFISYAIYTFSSFFDARVGESYNKATGFPPQVEVNDVLFAVHGAVMCCALIVQLFLYPPRTAPKRYTAVPALMVQMAVLCGLAASISGALDWYKYLRVAGGVKVVASVIKHFPQLYLNYHRSSTVGWSYTMILLDVVGGVFSMGQQVVRCMMMGNLKAFSSNMAKTTLAAESLLFDFYFIAQHVWFYPDHTDVDVIGIKVGAHEDLEKGHKRNGEDDDVPLMNATDLLASNNVTSQSGTHMQYQGRYTAAF
ncbi:unnamed protein product [Agarophyton chilense]|eukprot:gb/GEZJ01002387.1/.p1 GENE.gb/GEZJ01002387.1/~~gb/GEZJ01002387.1/.p1  ORF type:complete len:301 (-),score=23.02 gb/GEZJ01002387.1/:277-1179(-)